MPKQHDRVVYCRRWNFRRHTAMDPLTPEQAEARSKKGEEFAAVLWADPNAGVPEAVIEIVWQNNFAGVWFFDEQGRRSLNYAFHPSKGKLFLFDMVEYKYPDNNAHTLADASRVDHIGFNEDGTLREVVTDDLKHEKTAVDRRDVDLSSHWESMPTFGDWESLALWNRG
jgi:hypothetical protein